MHSFLPILAQATPLDRSVTISFIPSQIITWIIIGVIAGFIANLVVRGRHMSTLVAALLGIIGAIVGGFLFTLLQIQVSPALNDGITIRWIDIITATVGAVIVLFLFVVVFRRR